MVSGGLLVTIFAAVAAFALLVLVRLARISGTGRGSTDHSGAGHTGTGHPGTGQPKAVPGD
jgi:hypothetical protein